MSKTMGFRNSGKLDLGGKNMEYVLAGVLLIIIIVSVVLAVGPMQCGSGSAGPTGKPRVKCIKCDAEWDISEKDMGEYSREMDMGGVPIGADCPKCGKKGCVFLMIQCPNPKCHKYYLSKRITDPEGFEKDGGKTICPYCGTDLRKWYKEHHRR